MVNQLDFCGTEISSRSDVKVEGDKRLDKLESFLDKLHNKGTVLWKHNILKLSLCVSVCGPPFLFPAAVSSTRGEHQQTIDHRGDGRAGEGSDDPG